MNAKSTKILKRNKWQLAPDYPGRYTVFYLVLIFVFRVSKVFDILFDIPILKSFHYVSPCLKYCMQFANCSIFVSNIYFGTNFYSHRSRSILIKIEAAPWLIERSSLCGSYALSKHNRTRVLCETLAHHCIPLRIST